MSQEKTVVVFRTWKSGRAKGIVIALFPEIDAGEGLISSYEHIGQHGGADYYYVVHRTRPSTKAEYAPLLKELESIGYNLIVRKRGMRSKET